MWDLRTRGRFGAEGSEGTERDKMRTECEEEGGGRREGHLVILQFER